MARGKKKSGEEELKKIIDGLILLQEEQPDIFASLSAMIISTA